MSTALLLYLVAKPHIELFFLNNRVGNKDLFHFTILEANYVCVDFHCFFRLMENFLQSFPGESTNEHLNDRKTARKVQCHCYSLHMVKLLVLAPVERYCLSISIQLVARWVCCHAQRTLVGCCNGSFHL